ncbi:hypothetical protein GQ53DRAFT_224116 [Thozetella sp. PMI_491]|nr:hypothetical protein GQ53DRAFT_224116 [Thozetella sp. PMI_491]
MEPPFNDGEKRFVLAEMIKVSHIDVAYLIGFIQQTGLKPDWYSMQLPSGRNMNQCIRAWETMTTGQGPLPPSFTPEKRKSQDDLNEQQPKRPAAWSPAASGFPIAPINTSQPSIAPGPNGYSLSPSTASPTTAPLPRKRGRPSRADMEARTRQRAAHPTGYAPIAPVPGQAIIHPEKPEKPKRRGRISAAERKLEPAVLPWRAHEVPTTGPNAAGQEDAQKFGQQAVQMTDIGAPPTPASPPKAPPPEPPEAPAPIVDKKEPPVEQPPVEKPPQHHSTAPGSTGT